MPLSGSGRKAEKSASVPSRAAERGGPAGQAVKKQGAGWAGGQGQGHSAVESSLGFGAELEPPPSVTAAKTVSWKGGLWLGHWRRAALQGAVVGGYASWQRSAQEAP